MNKIKNPIWVSVFALFLALSAFAGYALAYRNIILPNVFISGVDVGGLNKEVAEAKILKTFKENPNKIIINKVDGSEIKLLNKLIVKRNTIWASDQALKVGRTGDILTDSKQRFDLFFKTKELVVPLEFNDNDLDDLVDEVSATASMEPVWPKIVKTKNGFEMVKGRSGLKINSDKLKSEIRDRLSYPGEQRVTVQTEEVKTEASEELANKIIANLNSWGDEKLELKHREYIKKISSEELAALFGVGNYNLNGDNFNKLLNEIIENVETEPKDAVFVFEEGRVNEFKPEVVGAIIDKPKFEKLLGDTLLSSKEKSLDIPVILSYPKIRAGEINNMGIKELIGVGKSSFGHSIPNRVFNVNLAASRINGVVVAPGEEFSFNEAVGEINRQSGYQAAYVISEGKTVLGDGGGVCQVSTTVFRAAMNFGFPITERKAHAYRVGYYEQDSAPGLDATIYSPSTDFKFLNDTGHHILVQTKVDTKNLTMRVEIYGTSDGRKSTISKPVITNQSSAPATSYIDDPNLPKGTTKQIDWSAAGAKVTFDYKVERGGESLFEKRFVSNYQPWRAVYLVGTGD
jgi:vancomycin resistance protein YoaR